MPTIALLNQSGEKVKDLELSAEVFGITEINQQVVYDVVNCQRAAMRQGTHDTKTRSEVSGGGRKPWRQKGTGNARQGSIRAPQWRHGGVALGPKPRDYSYAINKKVKRLALKSALSAKVAIEKFIVLDKLSLEDYKTKQMVKILSNLGVTTKALIIMAEPDNKIKKSAANISGVTTTLVNTINVYDILNHDKIIIAKDAVDKIEEIYKA